MHEPSRHSATTPKLITCFDDAGGASRPLIFALVGIVDVKKALDRFPVDAIYSFQMKSHPAHNKHIYPALVKKINKEGTSYSIWFAIKEINTQPNCTTQMDIRLTLIDIIEYRKKNPIVDFEANWIDYNSAISGYL
jgi:hypothetical protein